LLAIRSTYILLHTYGHRLEGRGEKGRAERKGRREGGEGGEGERIRGEEGEKRGDKMGREGEKRRMQQGEERGEK